MSTFKIENPKACPFCGSVDVFIMDELYEDPPVDGDYKWGCWVSCHDCNCELGKLDINSQECFMGSFETKAKAILTWNNRA